MIPVKPAPEPVDFDSVVRQPGLRAIAEMVGKKPNTRRPGGNSFKKVASREEDLKSDDFPAYWTKALDWMMESYGEVCAYSCFRIHRVTGASSVDHFAAKSRHWKKVYEWQNYRLCASALNGAKSDYSNVLDPFKIKERTFRLNPIYEVVPGPKLSAKERKKVANTIDRLKLNSERFTKRRREDADLYLNGQISLGVLRKESPFVAIELRRRRRLRAGDRWGQILPA